MRACLRNVGRLVSVSVPKPSRRTIPPRRRLSPLAPIPNVREAWRRAAVNPSVLHIRSLSTEHTQRVAGQEIDDALQALPLSCPGCGALTQWVEAADAGYYSLNRKSVKAYLRYLRAEPSIDLRTKSTTHRAGPLTPEAASQGLSADAAETAVAADLPYKSVSTPVSPPVCDRCHNVVHYSHGTSIWHPGISSIADTLAESPFKHNHVYHVLDAVDFPLSLIRNIYIHLDLVQQRSRNRRAKNPMFRGGRTTTISFIVTRSDLLAPQKDQIDRLMPYIVEVLRSALGEAGENARMGNVHLVSATRGWWTPKIKEEIWERGGGNWMVGKVNVGKSSLFQVLFPKGRNETLDYKSLQRAALDSRPDESANTTVEQKLNALRDMQHDRGQLSSSPTLPAQQKKAPLGADSLLPPPQPETQYPVMPLVSSLPGTTTSPIRVSFGNGRGELIDLPGLSRGQLENYVQPAHRASLVMTKRPKPQQLALKSSQSLLVVGGLVRITPLLPPNSEMVILASAFTPLKPHVTSTEKAIGTHTHQRESGVPVITTDEAGAAMASAGVFSLDTDVTRQRSRRLLAGSGRSVQDLPFRVVATDILIEGVGWVELAAQVRRRDVVLAQQDAGAGPCFPQVEVFSPKGKFVGARKPMNAWALSEKPPKPGPAHRPRRSMKGAKKAAKRARRAATIVT